MSCKLNSLFGSHQRWARSPNFSKFGRVGIEHDSVWNVGLKAEEKPCRSRAFG